MNALKSRTRQSPDNLGSGQQTNRLRRLGELLKETPKNEGTRELHGRGGQVASSDQTPPTLAEIGLTKDQSSRYQKLAAIPEERFEQAVAAARETAREVTTAAMLRTAKGEAAPKPASKPPAAPDQTEELRQLLAQRTEERDDIAATARELEDRLSTFECTEPDAQQQEILKLKKHVLRLEAEIMRLTRSRNDYQNKCNELIRQVKAMQRKAA